MIKRGTTWRGPRRQPAFLILRVAIPAALPNVFVGLFMGLGASFSVRDCRRNGWGKVGESGFYLQVGSEGWAAIRICTPRCW